MKKLFLSACIAIIFSACNSDLADSKERSAQSAREWKEWSEGEKEQKKIQELFNDSLPEAEPFDTLESIAYWGKMLSAATLCESLVNKDTIRYLYTRGVHPTFDSLRSGVICAPFDFKNQMFVGVDLGNGNTEEYIALFGFKYNPGRHLYQKYRRDNIGSPWKKVDETPMRPSVFWRRNPGIIKVLNHIIKVYSTKPRP